VVRSQTGDTSHYARKLRQLAGNAVANGMLWEAALDHGNITAELAVDLVESLFGKSTLMRD